MRVQIPEDHAGCIDLLLVKLRNREQEEVLLTALPAEEAAETPLLSAPSRLQRREEEVVLAGSRVSLCNRGSLTLLRSPAH